MRVRQAGASKVFKAAQWVGKRVGAALMGAASIRIFRPHAKHALAALLVAAGCGTAASQAFAEFPYVGTGTPSEPSSWKLKAGETPSNVFGLAWKFAATPATPPAGPPESETVKQNNSQTDELCGVTGMSLVDANAKFPAKTGSCIEEGSAVNTAASKKAAPSTPPSR